MLTAGSDRLFLAIGSDTTVYASILWSSAQNSMSLSESWAVFIAIRMHLATALSENEEHDWGLGISPVTSYSDVKGTRNMKVWGVEGCSVQAIMLPCPQMEQVGTHGDAAPHPPWPGRAPGLCRQEPPTRK